MPGRQPDHRSAPRRQHLLITACDKAQRCGVAAGSEADDRPQPASHSLTTEQTLPPL
jgi:hypothetical protein